MDAGVGKFRALPAYLGTAPKEVVGIACFQPGALSTFRKYTEELSNGRVEGLNISSR